MASRTINREHFFDAVRESLFKGKMRTEQVQGLTTILNEWDRSYTDSDIRWLAYMLATTFHETAATMQPIEEYGKGKGLKYGVADAVTGRVYYGRGYVQLTWKTNYEKFAKLLKVDLVNKPELALEAGVSTKILFIGMQKGLFTGKKLGDYFSDKVEDWVNARRIINGTDKAELIAGYGRAFCEAITWY